MGPVHCFLALRTLRFRIDNVAVGIDPSWASLDGGSTRRIDMTIREEHVRHLDETLNSRDRAFQMQPSGRQVFASAPAVVGGVRPAGLERGHFEFRRWRSSRLGAEWRGV